MIHPKLDLWPIVATLPCVVSALSPVTLHHCHGGSMAEIGVVRGTSQKVSDWLVIPLHADYHTGRFGIDSGSPVWGDVDVWEAAFKTQREHLTDLSLMLGINLFRMAGYDYTNWWLRNTP